MHFNRQVAFDILSMPNEFTQILGVVCTSTFIFYYHLLYIQIQNVLALNFSLLLLDNFNCILNAEDKKGDKTFNVNRAIHEF